MAVDQAERNGEVQNSLIDSRTVDRGDDILTAHQVRCTDAPRDIEEANLDGQ